MLDEEQAPEQPEYDAKRYTDAVARGLTGVRLAEAAGIPVPQGFSPPRITPTPVAPPPRDRWYSAANYVQRSPEDEFALELRNTVKNMPIKQAQEAINAAQQFQAMRTFQNKVKSGVDPALAAMEIAPLLNKGAAAGLAEMIKMRQASQPAQIVDEGGYKILRKPGQRDTVLPFKPKERPIVTPEGIYERNEQTGKLERTTQIEPVRKPIPVTGSGVWEWDKEAGQYKKTETFKKEPKYATRKVTIDPETGEPTAISGDFEDPAIQREMEAIKQKNAAKEAEPGFFKKAWESHPAVMAWKKLTAPKEVQPAAPPVEAPPITAPAAVEQPQEAEVIPEEGLIQMAKQAGVALILSKGEFDKLPSGARYMNKNGIISRKE